MPPNLTGMGIGISITSRYAGVGPTVAVANALARAKAAADAGLDHISLGDHHSNGPHANYVQNVPMIGRIMADWPADRPIGSLFLLPLWNPVLVAEQVGTLAAMTNAPFILQTGIGWGEADFAAMGARMAERGRHTDESIKVIKTLLAGGVADSDMLTVSGASISPRPPRPVEWWIGSGTGDVPLRRAAREGDAWYAPPGLATEELAEAATRYQDLCGEYGTKPRVALRRDILIRPNDSEAVRLGRDMIAAGYRGLGESQLVFGGVERVVERFAELVAAGADDIVIRIMNVEQPMALESIELAGMVRKSLS